MKKAIILPVLLLCLVACRKNLEDQCDDYQQAMRDFVVRISQTAKSENPNFVIIPQNGIELITTGETANSALARDYLAAIDGHGQEDLFYGYSSDETPTPSSETNYLLSYLRRSHNEGKTIFVTDYCSQNQHISDSYARCDAEGFVAFPAPHRSLNVIPTNSIHNENNDTIRKLSEVRNFLYLINPENYNTKQKFIDAVRATNYDLLIMDMFLDGDNAFTKDEVESLRQKANGGKRLVICYMSIGEAEDYRYYWNSAWSSNPPAWLAKENPDWDGNYKVRYWNAEWQAIICASRDSYLQRILNAGFDGAYLDIVDAYEYFE